MSVAPCADSSSELRPPFSNAVACRVFPEEPSRFYYDSSANRLEKCASWRSYRHTQMTRRQGNGPKASSTAEIAALKPRPAADKSAAGARNSGVLSMANVLNPEPESITLNTELETPTLEPATEQEQPSFESTSNPETAEVVEVPALDADAPTVPQAEAAPVEAAVEAEPTVEATTEVVVQPEPVAEPQAEAVTQVEPRRGCRRGPGSRSALHRVR